MSEQNALQESIFILGGSLRKGKGKSLLGRHYEMRHRGFSDTEAVN